MLRIQVQGRRARCGAERRKESGTIAPRDRRSYITGMKEIPFSSWRRSLDLTQVGVAEVLEYERRQIQHFERGTRTIPRTVRFSMAYLLEHPDEVERILSLSPLPPQTLRKSLAEQLARETLRKFREKYLAERVLEGI